MSCNALRTESRKGMLCILLLLGCSQPHEDAVPQDGTERPGRLTDTMDRTGEMGQEEPRSPDQGRGDVSETPGPDPAAEVPPLPDATDAVALDGAWELLDAGGPTDLASDQDSVSIPDLPDTPAPDDAETTETGSDADLSDVGGGPPPMPVSVALAIGGVELTVAGGLSIAQDGSVYLGASTYGDMLDLGDTVFLPPAGKPVGGFFLRVDAAGKIQWLVSTESHIEYGDLLVGYPEVAALPAGGIAVGVNTCAGYPNWQCDYPKEEWMWDIRDASAAGLGPAGTCSWVWNLGGGGQDLLWGVASSPDGSVYLAGRAGPESFASGFGQFGKDDAGDGFVAKLDAQGTPQWYRLVGVPGGFEAYDAAALAADPSGNVFFALDADNEYKYSFMVGDLDVGEAPGGLAITTFDSEGNLLWAKGAGCGSDEGWCDGDPTDARFTPDGGVILVGVAVGTTTLEFGPELESDFESVGLESGGFLVRFNKQGDTLWSRPVSLPAKDPEAFLIASDVSVTADGHFVVVGYFHGPNIDFGAGILEPLPDAKETSFVAEFDESGHVVWNRAFGVVGGMALASSVEAAPDGRTWIFGGFSGGDLEIGDMLIADPIPGGQGWWQTKSLYLVALDPFQ